MNLKINGATRIEIRFGDHVRVVWQDWRKMWDVFTDGQFLMSLSTFQGACEWAERYAKAREEALRVFVPPFVGLTAPPASRSVSAITSACFGMVMDSELSDHAVGATDSWGNPR